MTKYKIYHVGTMNSQYFGGNHNPVVQALVTGSTTYEELKEELLSSYNIDHIEELDTPAYIKAVELMFQSILPHEMENTFNASLEIPYDEEWDDYDCYAYFVVETVEEEE
jgi:hypothetical protein